MDDRLAINQAKTELRDGFNTGDIERVLSVFGDGYTDWSDGGASKFGSEAKDELKRKVTELFMGYEVKLTPIIIHIEILDGLAYDWGWHEFILAPKSDGEAIRKRERYFEIWRKDSAGKWRISFLITNRDVPEIVNGFATQWFRSEKQKIPA
jgi:ketosteroid isomerase-like protein